MHRNMLHCEGQNPASHDCNLMRNATDDGEAVG
jgi:hypothetical protein